MTPTPKNTVSAYLEALQKGKIQQQQELGCHSKELPKSKEPLTNIQKWEVVEQEPQASETDSDGRYNLVSAKVETKALGGFSVTRTWKFSVWKSEDFFESNKRLIDSLNQQAAKTYEVVNQVNTALGEPQVEPRKPVVPKRDNYSSKQYCVLRYEGESN